MDMKFLQNLLKVIQSLHININDRKIFKKKELISIWSEENKYKIWLDVEIAAAQAMEKLGQIPKGVASQVRKKLKLMLKEFIKLKIKLNMM